MNRKWSLALTLLLILFAVTMVSLPAFAWHFPGWPPRHDPRPFTAPEIDPRLTIEGLALAGGAAALIWERIRRRRR